jgi:hypothetical protein
MRAAIELLGQLIVAATLLWAAVAKLISPASRTDLAVFGITRPAAQRCARAAAVVVELAVAVLVLSGSRWGMLAAASLFTGFAGLLWWAIQRGGLGQRCGCFGRRGVVSWTAVGRAAALAALAVGVYALLIAPSERAIVTAALVGLGLVVTLLTAALLALAREVGVLRLALASDAALEIADEGPAVGERVDLRPWLTAGDVELVLALFVSAGCPLCRSLEPTLEFLRRDPWLAVLLLDEERDHAAWLTFDVPGAPYAVVLDPGGTVLAKGVGNTLPQIESVIATAARRREERAVHA